MTSFDKTFCASPNCVGDCGRKMSESLRMRLDSQKVKPISYGYFCGDPEEVCVTDDYALERGKLDDKC